MTFTPVTSNASVSFPAVAATVGAAVLALAVLAATPLGSVLLSSSVQVIVPVLFVLWLSVALVVDIKHWSDYGKVRKYVALLIWSALGVSVISSLPMLGIADTEIGQAFFRSLGMTWFSLALAADVKGWSGYTQSQRHFAFVVWFFLAGCRSNPSGLRPRLSTDLCVAKCSP